MSMSNGLNALVVGVLLPCSVLTCVGTACCTKTQEKTSDPDDRRIVFLQAAIDAASAKGGGVVCVPAGEWVTGPLVLKSGVTLELSEGATLLGSTDVADYAECDALISATAATNVAIVGKGVVDGRGGFFREPKKLRGEAQPTVPMLLKFKRCRDVRIEGVTYRASGSWGMHLMNCDGVVVRGVTFFNHVNRQNDGIDVESRNVLIEDCDIDADDDALVFKTESDKRFPVENIVVRRCRLASTCNFIKFGTGSYGLWRNIRVEDCELYRPKGAWRFNWARGRRNPGLTTHPCGLAGIALELADGGRMEDVTIRNITMTGGVAVPLFARLERRHVKGDARDSNFRNVVVENVRMTAPAESRIASSITGIPDQRLSGLTLRNCDFISPGGGTEAEAADRDIPEKEHSYPECFMFDHKALPAYGLYLRHVEGVVLENVTLRTALPDARPDIFREDVR